MFEADTPPHDRHPLARPGRASLTTSFRLAAVAAAYLLYLCAYFVLGPQAFGAQGHYWHDALVIAATGGLLVWSGLHHGPPMRLFLLVWMISGLTGCVNVDVNGYRAKGAAPGQRVACAGHCP